MSFNQKCIQEYIRVMKSVDMQGESVKRIVDNCIAQVPESRMDIKVPAIAAVSCAAVAAVAAIGIPKIKRNIDQKR